MMLFLKQIFTWWNGNTVGTRFFTWRRGKRIGEDQFGNIYYEDNDELCRRWVIYKNYSEASMIPPGWHGWIHYRTNIPPPQENYKAYKWEKPHKPNLTGMNSTAIHHCDTCKAVTGYDAWSPEE